MFFVYDIQCDCVSLVWDDCIDANLEAIEPEAMGVSGSFIFFQANISTEDIR